MNTTIYKILLISSMSIALLSGCVEDTASPDSVASKTKSGYDGSTSVLNQMSHDKSTSALNEISHKK